MTVQREAADATDGGLPVRDINNVVQYREVIGQCRKPRGAALTQLIQEAMNLHTAATHKSDPASDRAKVPSLAGSRVNQSTGGTIRARMETVLQPLLAGSHKDD